MTAAGGDVGRWAGWTEREPDLAMSADAIWTCTIGVRFSVNLPAGADLPMRNAIRAEFRRLTGADPEFIFSGWGGELTAAQTAVVESR